jgi:hypothetical protein
MIKSNTGASSVEDREEKEGGWTEEESLSSSSVVAYK